MVMAEKLIPLSEIRRHLASDSLQDFEAILKLANLALVHLPPYEIDYWLPKVSLPWMSIVLNELMKGENSDG